VPPFRCWFLYEELYHIRVDHEYVNLLIKRSTSGIPELVDNGISGFLVPEYDVGSLAEKINCLIDHPDLRSRMGKAGRAIVEKHYNISKLNDRLVDIYQRLLSGPPIRRLSRSVYGSS